MLQYILKRILQIIPTLLGVIFFLFLLFNWVGGDPAYILAGKISNPEQIANIRAQLGIDQPWYVQLWIFIQQVASADFGNSWSTNEAVSDILVTRLVPSLTLLIPLTIIESLTAIALALWIVQRFGKLSDRLVMIVCTVSMSVSILVYIIVMQYFLAYQLDWFPIQGWGDSLWINLSHFAPLPILIMIIVGLAPNLRLYRSIFLDEINQPYVRTARAKGLSERRIMWRHVLHNALIPIITSIVSSLPFLLVGAFLIERFFSIPGIGREVLAAVERSDFPVVKAITVYVAIATMLFNLLGDLLYRWADPRVELN